MQTGNKYYKYYKQICKTNTKMQNNSLCQWFSNFINFKEIMNHLT